MRDNIVSVYVDKQGEFYIRKDADDNWILSNIATEYKRPAPDEEIEEYVNAGIVNHYMITESRLADILIDLALKDYPAYYNPKNW